MQNIRNNPEIEVKKIVAEIFDLDVASIDRFLKLTDLDDWDSVTHLELIITVEKKFDVSFTGREIAQILSIDSLLTTLENK